MSEEHEYSLVMPFVCVTSAGGAYDDAAFVAGVGMGRVNAELERLTISTSAVAVEYRCMVPPAMVAQYDLVAMKNGFVLTTQEAVPGEWTEAIFRRPLPGSGS